MSEDNPYAPPMADLTDIKDFKWDSELAGRWTRFVASFVDAFIGLLYGIPIIYMFGYWDYIAARQRPPFSVTISGAALGFVGFLLIHGHLLNTNGQTIGKKLLKIRIVDLDGKIPSFATVILLRYLPISALALIPGVRRILVTD